MTNEEQLAREVDGALTYMSLGQGPCSLATKMRDAMIVSTPMLNVLSDIRVGHKLNRKIHRKELPGQWSATVMYAGQPGCLYEVVRVDILGRMAMSRMRMMHRGIDRRVREVARVEVADVREDGTFDLKTDYSGRFNDIDWIALFPIGTGKLIGGGEKVLGTPLVEIAEAMAWAVRNTWSVSFFAGGASVCYVTNGYGVKGLFRMRDKPEGRTRREALLHWVRDHQRIYRKDDEETVAEVRAHLRGAEEFDWFGMRSRIRTSEAEIGYGIANGFKRPSSVPQAVSTSAIRKRDSEL